jgi:hypothetical protein
MDCPAPQITQPLRAWSAGDQDALDQLMMPIVYENLHRLAQSYMAREQPDHTLQATSLVYEIYLRLLDAAHPSWQDRAHFFAVCARIVRRKLVDWARTHQAQHAAGQVHGGHPGDRQGRCGHVAGSGDSRNRVVSQGARAPSRLGWPFAARDSAAEGIHRGSLKKDGSRATGHQLLHGQLSSMFDLREAARTNARGGRDACHKGRPDPLSGSDLPRLTLKKLREPRRTSARRHRGNL